MNPSLFKTGGADLQKAQLITGATSEVYSSGDGCVFNKLLSRIMPLLIILMIGLTHLFLKKGK